MNNTVYPVNLGNWILKSFTRYVDLALSYQHVQNKLWSLFIVIYHYYPE